MKGRGAGFPGIIIIGIVGAIAGGLLFGLLGLIGSIVTAIYSRGRNISIFGLVYHEV